MVKFTIITACFNAEKCIADTVKSVQMQNYPNIEYIIIDGDSTDDTLDIVRNCFLKNSNAIEFKIYSEPDNGIYDAMNKGIKASTGDYIQFLNAGDTLYDENVVSNVAKNISFGAKEILYGNIIYIFPDGATALRKYGRLCGRPIYYLTGDCINHQSIFAARDCFKRYQFDYLKYKICADRDWMMKMSKGRTEFVPLDLIICNYSLDEKSASIVNTDLQWKEAKECILENYKWGYCIFCIFMFFRKSPILSRLLHLIYKIVFISKKQEKE